MLFMKERKHINAQYVITALQQRVTWKLMSMQFMKERNHISARFVTVALQKKVN